MEGDKLAGDKLAGDKLEGDKLAVAKLEGDKMTCHRYFLMVIMHFAESLVG